nr:ribosomal protein L4 [uncultured bacterium]
MEKIAVLALNGKKKEEIDVPSIFEAPLRFDLIRRAVKVTQSVKKQSQGRDPLAGKRNSVENWQTGYAVARVPRNKGSGFPKARNAVFVPQAVGGHLAFPPTTAKNNHIKINKQEKKVAFHSAVAATSKMEIVKDRGHKLENIKSLPLVIDDKIQTVKKTQKIEEILVDIGLWEDVIRAKNYQKLRPGKGKLRGRKYKHKKGPLLVIKEDFGIAKASRNIAGINVVNINRLSVENLAPGAMPGRLVLWTQSAFNSLSKM